MRNDRVIFTDGDKVKTVNPWSDDPTVWTDIGGSKTQDVDLKNADLYSRVAWLWRGVRIISTNVAGLPFSILNSKGEIIDSSDNYQNKVGFLQYPRKWLSLITASRQLTGRAYLYRLTNNKKMFKGFKYLNPLSVDPIYSEKPKPPPGTLLGFERKISMSRKQTEKVKVDLEDMVWLWMSDPYVEIGPAINYPAKAALTAVGVLTNVDSFISSYFGRGLVKATLLFASGFADTAEREKLETWWKRFFSGLMGANDQKVLNAEKLNVETIGEGLDGLEAKELTKTKREDIASAFGIPLTRLFSTEAGGLGGGGVVEADDRRFMLETIIPEAEEIFEILNDQVFSPLGYRIVLNKKQIDVFQEDETKRSESTSKLTQAITTNPRAAKLSMSILGYELSDAEETELKGMIAEQEARRERNEEARQQRIEALSQRNEPPLDETMSVKTGTEISGEILEVTPDREVRNIIMHFQESLKEVGQWQRNALRIGGDRASTEFQAHYLKGDIEKFIRDHLGRCKNKDEIKDVFTATRQKIEDGGEGEFLLWEIKVRKALQAGDPLDFDPGPGYSRVQKASIRGSLKKAKTEADIRRAFAGSSEFKNHP